MDGLINLIPTVTTEGVGATATIASNGSVTFAACTKLYIKGIFSSSYDSYMVKMFSNTSTTADYRLRLVLTDTENSTASSYTSQTLSSTSSTLTGARTSADSAQIGSGAGLRRDGLTIYIIGPNVAAPTPMRSVTTNDVNSASLLDIAITHNVSTAYTGFSIFPSTGTIAGKLVIYGFMK